MSSPDVARSRRNAGAIAATAVALGLLMLYPTSTNSTGGHRRPGTALAPVGVVPAPVATRATSAAPTSVTVNGTSVDTRYGPVQVQLVMVGKRIVTATAIDFPQSGGRDREINSVAVPQLQRETLAAQGAGIDTVSGATFTSEGYRTSLQAALDAAHLA
jgi:uncharacterized protein with FMN-binding domain